MALDATGEPGRDAAMLAIISPAKKLDVEPLGKAHQKLALTEPELLADAVHVHKAAKKLTAKKVAELMDLSEQLAELNFDRFAAWQAHHALGVNDGKPAALMFAGDVYTGLDAPSLDAKALTYGQEHLVILSGLYGALRPLDVIQPYRLEMGSKLAVKRGTKASKDLYTFWGDRVAKVIEARLADHKERAIVNLASSEYMKVARKHLTSPVLDVTFKEVKDGKPVALMLFAKRARGMMARFILEERVDRLAGLKDFGSDDYAYDATLSSDTDWVFTRPYRTAAMLAEAD